MKVKLKIQNGSKVITFNQGQNSKSRSNSKWVNLSLKKYFASLKANLRLMVKVKVTSF